MAITEAAICQEHEEKSEPPTRDVVWEIMRMLQNSKSPGERNIRTEIIKYGDKNLWEEIHLLMDVIWALERMPENWQNAIIWPIYKGD